MWPMPQAGFAPGVIDFSSDLSLLLSSLVAVLWLAAGGITMTTLQHFFTHSPRFLEETLPALLDDRDAA